MMLSNLFVRGSRGWLSPASARLCERSDCHDLFPAKLKDCMKD